MTVRWKPLLILSGLFVVIALVGVVAMAYTLIPKGSVDILPMARKERSAKQFDKALIRYKQALQVDGKNAAIHEEVAAMLGEWADSAPPEKQAELRAGRLSQLSEAANYGRNLKEPRRALLASAMRQDDVTEAVRWAKEVLALEPNHADAHYVLASEGLEARTPDLPEIKRHLAALEEVKAPEVRVAMVKARLAEAAGDTAGRDVILTKSRSLELPADATPIDRSALVRLRAHDVFTTLDIAQLPSRVKVLQDEARKMVSISSEATNLVMRLSFVLEAVQSQLTILASNQKDTKDKTGITALVDGIETDVESIFQQSLAAARKSNLRIYLNYASHLKFRGKRERSLEVIDEALASPLAQVPSASDVVMSLHELAVVDALSDQKDDARYGKAAPHIKALLGSSSSVFQGWGHLFQGAIEMEQSGMAGGEAGAKSTAGLSPADLSKLRTSSLAHLKAAASQFPSYAEAQARYGVALIAVQELELARQYLQNAIRLGSLDPQFQLWAAWSIVHAGYPEDAEPIVKRMFEDVKAGRTSRDYEGTLHLLSAEIHQGKRSPQDLQLAQAEFERSYTGKSTPAAVVIRLAQIDAQLGHPEKALQRLEPVRAEGKGGAGAESLAVIALLELNKKDEARAALTKARAQFPDSEELVGLEANLLTREKKLQEADATLAGYLERHPENLAVGLRRSQVLADLGNIKEARRLLANMADHCDNSQPLVQLALLDLKEKDYDAVAATIAKVRVRWKEATTADLLDAQLAYDQGHPTESIAHLDAALKKDPDNKLIQFRKAGIESQNGSSSDAKKAFEEIAKQGSSKEVEEGLSITAAANSALAKLALQNGDVDKAIQRFESLKAGGALGGLTRADRWQLALAYTVKSQWQAGKREIKLLLDDPKDPPTNDERVRAANFYRQANDEAAGIAQLDYVLTVEPTNTLAVVTKASILAEAGKLAEAAALIRKAIAIPQPAKEKAPPVFYLMLAALENSLAPKAEGAKCALAVVDQGLVSLPIALELVQAKYRLLLGMVGAKAAVAFVESRVKDDSDGMLTRLLADVYRDQGDLESAEKTLTGLVAKDPKDARLAAALVQVVATEGVKAGDLNDRDRERSCFDKTDALIRDFRAKFPAELTFLREDCEQAFRRGDLSRAMSITKEIDQLSRSSPMGPLLKAKIYAAQGQTSNVIEQYIEALNRNPRQPNVRVMLGQKCLAVGQTEEALKQATIALEAEPDRADALLLATRALATPVSSASQTATRQARAIELLTSALKRQPKFSAGYHELAVIRLYQGNPTAALEALKAGIEAVPDDALGIAQMVELLTQPSRDGKPASPDKLATADTIAKAVDARDTRGGPTLAVAIGYHKSDQLILARDWCEKAAAKLDTPAVHMNFGDILLALAERSRDDAEAKPYFQRAIEQYDKVLETQANSIEAVNNKAWILHGFKDDKKALALTEGLMSRVDPSILPAEFFDTVGAIQQALGNTRSAEDSYNKGLKKSANHPVLNYHMAKLISTDNRRAEKAKSYLEKANAQKEKLSPSMAADVVSMMERSTR